MAQYVRVTEDESLPAIELPTESDGAILLSTLQAQFPGACGLRYKNPETDSWRGIRLLDNMLCPPADEGWGCHLYVVVQKNGKCMIRRYNGSFVSLPCLCNRRAYKRYLHSYQWRYGGEIAKPQFMLFFRIIIYLYLLVT